jgi:hypothetical protein
VSGARMAPLSASFALVLFFGVTMTSVSRPSLTQDLCGSTESGKKKENFETAHKNTTGKFFILFRTNVNPDEGVLHNPNGQNFPRKDHLDLI